VSRDVIWQPGHVAEESITVMADGFGDGRETSGRGDRVIADKLVPLDLDCWTDYNLVRATFQHRIRTSICKKKPKMHLDTKASQNPDKAIRN